MKQYDAIAYVGDGRHTRQDPEALLRSMDEAGIDCAAIAAADRFLAVSNREGNELLLAAARAHPGRFVALASANPWFEREAADTLRRALEAGARGVILHPLYQGARLSDPLYRPLLEVAAAARAVVYAPTGLPMIAEPLQLADWARQFPRLPFVMGHAGASDYYADAVLAASFADNIWLETSRNGAANYQLFALKGLARRMVFGSAAPQYIPAVEMRILRECLNDPALEREIFSRNFERLFGLGSAP